MPPRAGIFSYDGCPSGNALQRWVQHTLPSRLKFEAREEAWERYRGKFAEMGRVVECFLDDKGRCSPSVRCRIDPLGKIELVSTHEQVLGGPSQYCSKAAGFVTGPVGRTFSAPSRGHWDPSHAKSGRELARTDAARLASFLLLSYGPAAPVRASLVPIVT